jgi:molybdopterin-guanine dinucleotide biosynthesis protein B
LIGYHNSGKTFVGAKIASELKARGYSVSAVKHIHGDLEYSDKDTAQFALHCTQVVGLKENEVYTIEKRKTSLQNILLSIQTDFTIIEGFKDAATFPKIICHQPGKTSLDHPLAVAHAGMNEIDDKKISRLCDLIEQKAFFLAGADCKKCGFPTCFEYAQAILSGKTTKTDCLSLPQDIHVSIDGEVFPLHSFVSNTLKGTILGFIRNLKGYKEGKVVIKISG